jgi:hypothetical protein
VRDQGNVTCSGVARDNDAFVKVFGKLSDDTNEFQRASRNAGAEADAIHADFSMAGRSRQWKLRTAKNSC